MAEPRTREIKITIPEELFSFFIPEKSLHHLVNAKKEMLLALRALIDSRIEALEKRQTRKQETKKKISIE